MGLQPYYTISASLLLKQFKPEDPVIRNNRLNIFFSSESEFIPHLYTILCELTNGYVFSVADSLIKNTQTLAELLPKLFLLTAINRSAKGEKKVPLFLTNAKESPDIDTIKLYFAQQGIPDIAFPLFCSDSEFNTQSIDGCYFVILPPKPTDMAIILREIVANKEITIITFREPISDLTTIEDIARMIKGLKRPDELDFDFEEANTHYIDREEFETERSLWRKRALLYQDFLRLSKTVQQKEYYDIIDWYHKEYEILPTWYKRFGHIIKVIMGKRSLGSLFSNKKKYNN